MVIYMKNKTKRLRKIVKTKKALGTFGSFLTRVKIVLMLSGVVLWLIIFLNMKGCGLKAHSYQAYTNINTPYYKVYQIDTPNVFPFNDSSALKWIEEHDLYDDLYDFYITTKDTVEKTKNKK